MALDAVKEREAYYKQKQEDAKKNGDSVSADTEVADDEKAAPAKVCQTCFVQDATRPVCYRFDQSWTPVWSNPDSTKSFSPRGSLCCCAQGSSSGVQAVKKAPAPYEGGSAEPTPAEAASGRAPATDAADQNGADTPQVPRDSVESLYLHIQTMPFYLSACSSGICSRLHSMEMCLSSLQGVWAAESSAAVPAAASTNGPTASPSAGVSVGLTHAEDGSVSLKLSVGDDL